MISTQKLHKFERGVDPDCHDSLRRFIKIVGHVNIKDMSMISLTYKDRPVKIPVNVDKVNQTRHKH